MAAASIYYGEPQPEEPSQSAATPAALTASPVTTLPTTTADSKQPALDVTEAAAAVSSSTTVSAVPALPDAAPRKVAAAQNTEDNLARAAALRDADKEMQPAGFGAACFDQMRSFFCPIVGRIPVFREMAAQMATIGGFSCPLGSPPPKGT